MINVLVNCPSPKDATSLYRGIGPLGEIQRQNHDINLTFVGEYSWTTFALADIFFMQRPYTQAHLDMILMAKDNGVPVWVDYDDDLFSVPVSNPAYRVYSSEGIRKCVANIIANVDVVTVSTPFLKKQFERGPKPLNKDIRVIPNSLNNRIFNYRKSPDGERKRLVMWRGSTTHHKDLFFHADSIVKKVNADPTWTWLFQGDKPWFLFERLGDNAIFADSLDPILYFKHMHEMKPPVMIVPLHDCEFNRSKSNIAWLEACFFGAMTLAPDWEEWQRPGCINYKNREDFDIKLGEIMSGLHNPTNLANDGWRYIEKNLFLSQVNKDRVQIIRDLVK